MVNGSAGEFETESFRQRERNGSNWNWQAQVAAALFQITTFQYCGGFRLW